MIQLLLVGWATLLPDGVIPSSRFSLEVRHLRIPMSKIKSPKSSKKVLGRATQLWSLSTSVTPSTECSTSAQLGNRKLELFFCLHKKQRGLELRLCASEVRYRTNKGDQGFRDSRMAGFRSWAVDLNTETIFGMWQDGNQKHLFTFVGKQSKRK